MKERVLFVGGKNIGVAILGNLIQDDIVIGVYTNESDLSESWYMRTKPIAEIEMIPYSTDNINNKREEISKLKPDWIVCAYYDRIISNEILSIPEKGAINVHMGLSNEYRGCYPTTFPIIDGKDHAGVTIHQITSDIDGGDVYATSTVKIEQHETGKSLYDKCTYTAINLFNEVWTKIKSGKLKPKKILEKGSYYTRNDFPSHEINIEWTPDKIDRMVRALTFPPFPRPYFIINNNKYEIIFG